MPSRGIIFNLQPYLKQYNTENTMKNSKSIPFVLLALLLTTVSSCINSVKYEVVIPEFEKVITVKRGTVQFRKPPAYKAAKLCYICEDDTDNCCLVWSDSQVEPGYSKSSFYAMKDQTFLVVEDTADWYGVIVEGYKAYLPKKYTKEAVVEPITPEMLTQKDFYGHEYEQCPGISKGKYQGYAVVNQNGWDSEGYMLGHIVDGLLVLTHHISGYSTFIEDDSRLSKFQKNENGYWDIEFGTGVAADEISEWNGRILDFNKLNEEEFEKFLEAADVAAPYDCIVIIACINGQYQIIADNINIKEIPEEMKSVAVF